MIQPPTLHCKTRFLEDWNKNAIWQGVTLTCLWWYSSNLNFSGPTFIWVFSSKSASSMLDSNLMVPNGSLDRSCTRYLPLGKPFTWKKFESGRGNTDSTLDVSLADLISTCKPDFNPSSFFPSTWPLKMVKSGRSKTRKSKPLISSDPTYENWSIYRFQM